jgi:hypothetical protein
MATAELRSFNPSGYEILDDDLVSEGVAVIWSVSPVTPRLGDSFLLECEGRLYDVEVETLATFRGGGWSATCRQA